MAQDIITIITQAGGREWKKYGTHRIYLDIETAYELAGGSISFYKTGNVSGATLPVYGELSNRRAYVESVFYDMGDKKFHARGADCDVVRFIVDQLTSWLDAQLSENPVYAMTVTHMPQQQEDYTYTQQEGFTYTGTLTELVEQIEADVFSYELSDGPEFMEFMAEIEATEDEAEELLEEEGLSVEPGQTLWILFDESKHIEKPEITLCLVKGYASRVYDAHIWNIFMEKIHAEAM